MTRSVLDAASDLTLARCVKRGSQGNFSSEIVEQFFWKNLYIRNAGIYHDCYDVTEYLSFSV